MRAVADASSLIHSAKNPRFWTLMKRTFDEVLIPEGVFQEILKGREIGSSDVTIIEGEITNAWIKVRKVRKLLNLPKNLGRGEREAISLMKETRADWLLIDDRVASITARLMGLKTRSSAYLLIFWNRKGVIKQALELLDNLVNVGYRLGSKDYVSIKKHIKILPK